MSNHQSILLELDTHAWAIESVLTEYVRPYQLGLYLRGQERPITDPTATYFQNGKALYAAGLAPPWQPPGVLELTDDAPVVDVHGNEVISVKALRHSKNTITLTPQVPVYGRFVAEAFVNDLLSTYAIYEKQRSVYLENAYRALLIDYDHWQDVSNKITIVTQVLDEMVSDFVGGQSWTIHLLRRVGADLVIEKHEDYRVYAYMRLTNNGETTINGY